MRTIGLRYPFKAFFLLVTRKRLAPVFCTIVLISTAALLLIVGGKKNASDSQSSTEHPKKIPAESVADPMPVKMDEGKVFINDAVPWGLLNGKQEELKPRKNLILLSSSLPRSGSTFIGELISSAPGSIYFYEPDFLLQHTCQLENCYSQLLADIFTCSFNESYMEFMVKKRIFFSFLNDDVKVCESLTGKDSQDCRRGFDMLAMCRAATTIVVKTIRLRLSWIQRDMSKFPSHLKVILLNRDPRAIRLSTSKFGWVKDTERLCSNLQDDLNTYTAFRENFDGVKQIIYEHFCSDTVNNTKDLFSFLGYADTPESTQTYLQVHTKYEGPKRGPLSTLSWSSEIYSKWRKIIKERPLYNVESLQTCRNVISRLNFTLFGSIDRVRNFNISVFKREED